MSIFAAEWPKNFPTVAGQFSAVSLSMTMLQRHIVYTIGMHSCTTFYYLSYFYGLVKPSCLMWEGMKESMLLRFFYILLLGSLHCWLIATKWWGRALILWWLRESRVEVLFSEHWSLPTATWLFSRYWFDLVDWLPDHDGWWMGYSSDSMQLDLTGARVH